MALCSPLTTPSDGFEGVTCTGLKLSDIASVFYQAPDLRRITYAIEIATGRMTACSRPGMVDVPEPDGSSEVQLMYAENHTEPLIRNSARFLYREWIGTPEEVAAEADATFTFVTHGTFFVTYLCRCRR